jgi:hypothetical protein
MYLLLTGLFDIRHFEGRLYEGKLFVVLKSAEIVLFETLLD